MRLTSSNAAVVIWQIDWICETIVWAAYQAILALMIKITISLINSTEIFSWTTIISFTWFITTIKKWLMLKFYRTIVSSAFVTFLALIIVITVSFIISTGIATSTSCFKKIACNAMEIISFNMKIQTLFCFEWKCTYTLCQDYFLHDTN